MKKFLLSILFFISIVGCSKKPDDIVVKLINDIKTKKFNNLKKYVINETFSKEITVKYEYEIQKDFHDLLLKNMEYKIIASEKQADDSHLVTVQVKNIDVDKVFVKLYQNIIKQAVGKNSKSPDLEVELKSILTSSDVPKAEFETVFHLINTEEGYKINLTEENVDVLFGKFNSVMQRIQSGNLNIE